MRAVDGLVPSHSNSIAEVRFHSPPASDSMCDFGACGGCPSFLCTINLSCHLRQFCLQLSHVLAE
jgi:hypothetical protein